MGIVAKQSVITTILLYVGAVLGYINILYLYPRFMDLSQIGTTRTLQDMAALMVPIAQFGLTHSLIRFYPKAALSEKGRKGFLGLILVFGIGGYILFYGLFTLFQPYIISYFENQAANFVQYIPEVLLITFLLVIYNLLVAYAQSLLKIIAANFIKDVLFRLLIALFLFLYFFEYINFNQFIISIVACYAAMTLAIVSYLLYLKQISLGFDFSFITKYDLSSLLIFALFSLLGTSGMLIIGKIDSIMVTGMLGLDLNGLYTTVFYIAVIIEFPKRAINQISLPLVSRAFDDNKLHEISLLYKQSSINQLIIGGLLFIGLWVNLDNIFAFMPKGDTFEAGKYVIIFIGIGRLFDMLAGINSEIIVMSKHFRFNMVLLGVLAVLSIVFNLIFIPLYGINGAALGSALALILFNIAKFVFLWLKLRIQPFSVQTLKVLLLLATSLLLGFVFPKSASVFVDILIRSSVVSLFFFAGILWSRPSPELHDLILRILKIFRKR
ncbi:MAG: polysaccharide biosynthesis C-terminal domain-containing protein [Cyclobacteriaceae bacterium]|nr:polysaccharide biosynthesis C-terminal domain-containing protein [Cyclobacteriaceae bacterium]